MSDTTGNGSSQPGATPPAATPAEPAGATTTAAPDTRPASPGRQASPTTSTAIHDITFRRVFRELIGFMWPYRKLFAISMTGALLFSLGANGRLLLLQPITDKVFMPGGDLADADKLQNLTWIVLAMLVITLIQGPAGWIRQYYGSQMSQKLRIDVQRHIQKHLLTLDMNFYIRHRQGDLMSRVLGDMGAVMGAVEHVLTALPVFVFLAVTGLAVAIYASWRLALLCTLVIPLLSFMLSFLSKRLRHWARMRSAAGGEVNDRLQESMNGIRVVKSFRREERERQRFIDATDTLYERSMAAVRYMTLNSSGVDFLYNLLIAGLVLLGGWLVLTTFTDANGNEYTLLTGGYLIMFIGALVSLYDPVRRISRSINMYQNAMAAAERVFEVLDLKPSIRDADDAVAHDTFESGVELDAVCFDYDEAADRAGSLSWDPVTSAPAEAKVADPDAPARRKAFNLQNVSFVAKKGEVIALVGERGSGKSTILDLILRLYDPTSGSVKIDGIDIRKIKSSSLQNMFAVVTQETFLFNTSIAENIAYARPDATREQIIEAAKAANILEFIERQPDGMDTQVGARGARLSGGERQSIAIARALMADAPILVLDEATSNLDSVSERRIQDGLERLMEHRTVFVVAHRLSTIRHANRIIVMKAGEIAETGTHDELIARNGVYAHLHATQFRLPDAERVS